MKIHENIKQSQGLVIPRPRQWDESCFHLNLGNDKSKLGGKMTKIIILSNIKRLPVCR